MSTAPRAKGPRKQRDHIMAAKPSGRRSEVYKSVVLEFARTLHEDALAGKAGGGGREVTELLDCYLMDLASIAVTDDNRSDGVVRPGEIAKVYNRYRSLLLGDLATTDPLRELFPAEKTMMNVLGDYSGMGFTVAGAVIGSAASNLMSRLGFGGSRST